MRKILFIVVDIHERRGGDRVTTNLCNYFSNYGNKVTLLSLGKKDNKREIFPLDKNVNIEYLNINQNGIRNKLKTLVSINRYFNCHDYNFIVGIGTYVSVLLSMTAPKGSLNIGCEHSAYNSVGIHWKILRTLFYRKLDACTVLTYTDLRFVDKISKYSCVIPNWREVPEKRSPVNSNICLAIGSLTHEKGFDLMLDVFKKVAVKNKNLLLRIVGEGPLETELRSKIKELELDGRVQIFPFTSEIEKYYLDASMYIMTSRFEGLPMVLLEAQSYGIPMISYDCETGPRDLIHNGENGYLIPWGDSDKMAEAILKLGNNHVLCKGMGENARKDALNYEKDNIAEQWEKLFAKLQNL